jgi:hypothetical protein
VSLLRLLLRGVAGDGCAAVVELLVLRTSSPFFAATQDGRACGRPIVRCSRPFRGSARLCGTL